MGDRGAWRREDMACHMDIKIVVRRRKVGVG
jgi:hypothetical protein